MNPQYASLLVELRKLYDAARDAFIEEERAPQSKEFREWILKVMIKAGEHIERIVEE